MLTRYYGTTQFDSIKMGNVMVPNITKGISIPDIYKKDPRYFTQYTLRDSDRLDTLSNTVYGTTKFWWLIALMNDMYDIRESMPLNDDEFNAMLKDKYPLSQSLDVLFYTDSGGNITDPYAIGRLDNIDIDNVIIRYGLTPITIYDYEIEMNNRNREIKILNPEFAGNIIDILEKEFDDA
jgi:hypothetical protein